MASAIPQGSTVLVTGINGYIGSHIADQVLQAGYRVRGTVRSLEKGKAIKTILEAKHGKANVEILVVSNMDIDGAFNEAVKGVSGVIHVASNVSLSSDPHQVIPEVIAGIKSILFSAAQEPSVKRFIFTSSSVAASAPKPGQKLIITKDSWNEDDIAAAWAPPPYVNRPWIVYGASKTQAEQALWQFVKEQKPDFVANAILPNANFGGRLEESQTASTSAWILDIFRGHAEYTKDIPSQHFIDVRDTARLHLAALVNPDVQNERLFGYAQPFNFKHIFAIIKKKWPERQLPEDLSNDDLDQFVIVERPRALELLKTVGRDDFVSLEQSVIETIEAFDKA